MLMLAVHLLRLVTKRLQFLLTCAAGVVLANPPHGTCAAGVVSRPRLGITRADADACCPSAEVGADTVTNPTLIMELV